ncbi:MAG: hypothetical protein E7491_02970 [Ruminococcaceae bacterium]|nr:hypothetical protein [Oscillospiraceae bacterium]
MYSKDNVKCCEVCAFATNMSTQSDQLCVKKGPVSADYCCSSFKYDATRRKPKKKAELQKFSSEDFKL